MLSLSPPPKFPFHENLEPIFPSVFLSVSRKLKPMDFSDFDTVKAEKANAILKYHRLQTLTKLFRLLEFCLALVLLSWIFNRLPFAVKISGEFFRRLAGIIASPLFVFLVAHAIIATLIVKSGISFGENHNANNAETQLYDELIKNTENHNCPKSLPSENPDDMSLSQGTTQRETIPATNEEEVVYQEKRIIISSVANSFTHTRGNEDEVHDPDVASTYSDSDSDFENVKPFRWTKWEKMERKNHVKQLRRLEMEKLVSREEKENSFCREDELSDEEFQRAVDEFIAKHLRFRRQESMSVVVHNQKSSISQLENQC